MSGAIDLVAGPVELVLVPDCGGGIAAFRFAGEDVMRPADPAAITRRDPLGLASFPLVPWSNRIAFGRFVFEGRAVQLPRNMDDHPHAIHGHGWQKPWRVGSVGDRGATLIYDHTPDAWPWAYRATQHFVVREDGFDIVLAVENCSDRAMPAGLGHHPYYRRTPGMRLEARLDGWWETDALVMPVAYRAIAPKTDWSDWLHAERTTDNVFSGWDGHAVITWPERNLALSMTADAAARWMVVYAPTDAAIACIEGVTHPTDALNDPALPGIQILPPGASFALRTSFQVARTGAA